MRTIKEKQRKKRFCSWSAILLAAATALAFICPVAAEETKGATIDAADTPAVAQKEIPEKNKILLVGGWNFGVQIQTDGVLVVGLGNEPTGDGRDSPAYRAGIRLKDLIVSVNGKKTASAGEVAKAVVDSGGSPISVTVRRASETRDFTVIPTKDEKGSPKIGVWLRDSSAGIGTVTFIDPETGAFGGLGHGITDPETGALIPTRRGTLTDAVITGLVRGTAGSPGEMKGYLGKEKRGVLLRNTECGVFGIYTKFPEAGLRLPAASPEEVKVGEATILCTLDGKKAEGYTVRITAIHPEDKGTKSFSLEVTDDRLLQKSGGIIQGMSGSPVLQNGKIIGAVTHVLIRDPHCGYGIFIDSMLSSLPEVLK